MKRNHSSDHAIYSTELIKDAFEPIKTAEIRNCVPTYSTFKGFTVVHYHAGEKDF